MRDTERLFKMMCNYPVILYGYLDPSQNDSDGTQTFNVFSNRLFFGNEHERYICNEKNRVFNNGFNQVHMKFKAYYLPSEPNNTTEMQLFNDADFFITDRLSGCTFLAVKIDNKVLCYHINKLTSEGDIDPDAIEQEINDILLNLKIDENSILLRLDQKDSDLSDEHLSVIGTCIDNTWSFHYQTYKINRDISFTLNTTMDEEQKINNIKLF